MFIMLILSQKKKLKKNPAIEAADRDFAKVELDFDQERLPF